jgi:hypothetical protein
MHERAAHVIDFFDKIRVQLEGAAVIMDTVNELIMRLARTHPREDMDFVSFAFERRRQLGDMGGDSSDGDGMKRLPN